MKKAIALLFALGLSANMAFADSIADSSNYLPGGKYRLFGGGRGTVTNVENNIRVGGGLTQQVGNLAISTTTYQGGLSYAQEFHNHGWRVHSPFANTARQDFHSKNGKIAQGGGATLTDLSVTGYEIHPADGYDGEQGGGYPTPTGARDEYLYLVNGKEVSVKIVNPDKLPPKANDDKILRNVGIDPTPYNQTNLNDRPTFEKLTLVGANDSGGLTGYNGSAENGSADTSTNGNGWNNAETGSPLSLYNGQHDSNPYGVQPYHLNPASLTTDGNAAGEYNPQKSPYDVFSKPNWNDVAKGAKNEFAASARDAQSTGLQYEFPADVAKDISGGYDHYTDPDPYAPTNPSQQIGANAALVGSLALGGKNPMSAANKAVNKATNVNHIWSKGAKPSSVDNAYGHWIKHGSDFPQYQNAKKYAHGENDFVKNPPTGTLTKTKNGDTMYYHPQSNTYVVTNSNGEVKTMFKPTRGKAYFDGK
ncbi:MAG: MafB family polymorphic toxin [Neisseriaceae bacterium]|nr:MafB family polymorphic toxin [Neisseriaceae bacterium]